MLVEHRSALSLARAFIGRHAIGPADRVFGFFAPTFDPSVLDLLLALLSGATLRLWDQVGGGGGDWRASRVRVRVRVSPTPNPNPNPTPPPNQASLALAEPRHGGRPGC